MSNETVTVYRVVQCDTLEEDQEKDEIGKGGDQIDQSTGVTNVQTEKREQNRPGDEERQ